MHHRVQYCQTHASGFFMHWTVKCKVLLFNGGFYGRFSGCFENFHFKFSLVAYNINRMYQGLSIQYVSSVQYNYSGGVYCQVIVIRPC